MIRKKAPLAVYPVPLTSLLEVYAVVAASKEALLEGMQYCNTLLYDIKSMDPVKHKQFTGYSNEKIIENLAAVRKAYPKLNIRVRTPVIPGFNNTEEDIRNIVEFLKNYEVQLVNYVLLSKTLMA